MLGNPFGLWGLNLVEDANLTVPDVPRVRSWRERLFSRPWKPMLRTAETRKPDSNVYVLQGRNVVAHPITAQRIRLALEKGPQP